MNTYKHVEALNRRSYTLNCVDFGYLSPILIADWNLNVVFKYREDEKELNSARNKDARNKDALDNDLEDCENFWASVLMVTLSKGCWGRTLQSIDVKPN